jgi:hypothetical protein
VMADCPCVALHRVTQAPPDAGAGLLGRGRHRPEDPRAQLAQHPDALGPRQRSDVVAGQHHHPGEQVALHVDVPRHISPGQAQVARSRRHVVERARIADDDPADRVLGPGDAPIKSFKGDRHAGREDIGQGLSPPSRELSSLVYLPTHLSYRSVNLRSGS